MGEAEKRPGDRAAHLLVRDEAAGRGPTPAIPTQGQAVRRRLRGDQEGVQPLSEPVSAWARALTEETHAGATSGYTLAEALLKLFRLPD
jgi:hypothetical protein